MPKTSEELSKTIYELSYLRAQAEQAQRQLAAMTEMLEENTAVEAALKEIRHPDKAIFPMGAGIYIKTSLAEVERQRVLVDVGAKVFMDKTPEEAAALLQERRRELMKAAQTLQAAIGELVKRIEELDAQTKRLVAMERKA